MLLRRSLVLLLAVLISAVAPRLAFAQSEPAPASSRTPQLALRGIVLDPMRAPIAGARITVTAEQSLAGLPTVSDEHGNFTIIFESGRYTVTVVADGFLSLSQVIDAAQVGPEPREFVLSVAGFRETVDVSAPAPGYQVPTITSGTKTPTALRDVPQSITVVTKELIQDQLMLSLGDVVRYVPGITAHQGENNRDQVIIRGNSSSADFFLDGVRDDVQYYRDLYNIDRVEALKGPNAMMFGRGGGGGVINRVSKAAEFARVRDVTLLGGSFGSKRIAGDVDEPLGDRAAVRVSGLYERSDSFRQSVNRERYGVNPTVTIAVSPQTRLTVGHERFRDNRVADRGIPSFQGRPADVDVATYFGDPTQSHVNARADVTSATIAHMAGAVTVHNRILVGDYERGYQNFVPGAVSADKIHVSLSAYNNDTQRLNVFNQTDVTYTVSTGSFRHTLLAGAEVGRQLTDNFRNTGYFNGATTTTLAPYANPTVNTPLIFRQSATDADNHLRTTVTAAYAQDQIELSRRVQVLAGLRFDAFDLEYHNNRTGADLSRVDHLLSPRVGLVLKPTVPLSIYGSYAVSYLPSSGDQFSSLTAITEQVKPEKFNNYEMGAKWDLQPNLSLTTALYRLDRTNTRATDPNAPTRIVQTGSQRTNGHELGINGRITPLWQMAGGYAYQNAFVTSATAAAPAGARVAQVPHHTLSLWNTYQVHQKVGMGLGIVWRTDMYAAIDNTVTLPGYTDVDAAVYVSLTPRMRLQANVENLFDRKYYVNADGNTNISPGSPRAVRVALTARF